MNIQSIKDIFYMNNLKYVKGIIIKNGKYVPKTKQELELLLVEVDKENVFCRDIDISIIKEKFKNEKNKYFPQNRKELILLVINKSIYLGDIDISLITDMSYLFAYSDRTDFSGIETWDVSNVTNMSFMFYRCYNFNCDISNWNVSNITNMSFMFAWCFRFNQDLSKWKIRLDCENTSIFYECPIQENYKPKI